MNDTIRIRDKNKILDIHYSSLKEYHQDTNYAMLAITFKAIHLACQLFETIPNRKDIKVLSAHLGTGVRDAFEFVTRVVTNNNYKVDCNLPFANYNPHTQMGYYFEITYEDKIVKLTLKENILKNNFFDFFGKSLHKTITKDELIEFETLKKSIENEVLQKDCNEIFRFEVEKIKKFIFYITSNTEMSGGILKHPQTSPYIDFVDIYDFKGDELENYDVLLIGTDIDQRMLYEKKTYIDKFLSNKKTVVFCGALAYPFLDDVGEFKKMDYIDYTDYKITKFSNHKVWEGVEPKDMMYRKGVAGFYSRGYNPPPKNATVINTLGRSKHPIDYEYDTKDGGKVLVHCGNNLWLFLNDNTTASKIGINLINWLKDIKK